MSAANGLAMLTDGKAPRNAPKTSADASVHHPTAILISENKIETLWLCRWSQSGLPLTVNDERVLCLQKSVSVHPAISSDQQRSSQSKSLPVVGEILSSIKQDVASYAGDAAGNQHSRITLQQRLATKDPRLPLDHLDASIYALFQSPTPLLSLTNPTHLRLPTRRSFLRKSPYSNTPIIRHGGRPY
jgi:hypothetical protein